MTLRSQQRMKILVPFLLTPIFKLVRYDEFAATENAKHILQTPGC